MDRVIVRQAYESAISRVARLSMYACGITARYVEYEVAERCRKLALDDLVAGALSMRRLMDATNLVPLCQHAWLPSAEIEADQFSERAVRADPISAWQVFGAVVHARRLELIDEKFSLALHAGKRASDIAEERHAEASVPISPICYVKSDQRELRFFVEDVTGRCQALLDSSRKVASQHRLHLDSDFDV